MATDIIAKGTGLAVAAVTKSEKGEFRRVFMQNSAGQILEVDYQYQRWDATVISEIPNMPADCIPKKDTPLAVVKGKDMQWIRLYYLTQAHWIAELKWTEATHAWVAATIKIDGQRVKAYKDSSIAALSLCGGPNEALGRFHVVLYTQTPEGPIQEHALYAENGKIPAWSAIHKCPVPAMFGTKIAASTIWYGAYAVIKVYFQDPESKLVEYDYAGDRNKWDHRYLFFSKPLDLVPCSLATVWAEDSSMSGLRLFTIFLGDDREHYVRQWGVMGEPLTWQPLGRAIGPVTTGTKLAAEVLPGPVVRVYVQDEENSPKVTMWKCLEDGGDFNPEAPLPPTPYIPTHLV